MQFINTFLHQIKLFFWRSQLPPNSLLLLVRSVSCYQVTCQPQTRAVTPHRRWLLCPLWPSATESAGTSILHHVVCTEARPTRIEIFTPLMKTQPQQSHVSSTGLYSLRNPGNSSRIGCVKAGHQGQGPSVLSPWVKCSTFDKKLRTPTSPSGRKVWEVWGLLAERVPSPAAQRPASQQDLPPLLHLPDPARPAAAQRIPAPISSSPRVSSRRRAEEMLR